MQSLLGHADVSTTMIYTHVLKSSAAGTASPLDALAAMSRLPIATAPNPTTPPFARPRSDADADASDDDPPDSAAFPWQLREPPAPCYRATPSCTAAATSAS